MDSIAVQKAEVDRNRYPLYVWDRKEVVYVNRREKDLVEWYIETGSVNECRKRFKEKYRRELSYEGVNHWLGRERTAAYLRQRVEESGITAGWTEGRWYKVMTEHMEGHKEMEQAVEDIRSYEEILKGTPGDMEAKVGLVNARKRHLEGKKKRLASGDLFAMRLIAQSKGWGGEGKGVSIVNQIAFTQANGKE